MRYGSVCSGMEAASLAWAPLGWECAFVAEHDPTSKSKGPQAAQEFLAQRFPNVPNFGDITKFAEWPDASIDLLVGGTPCQSFSVAGLRKGLDDPRGSLMLTYGAIAKRYRPKWLVWENVPGVLSHDRGRSFGTFLGMLAELGYGFAYRVLDAQYFNLAQRRARVFVVGYLGDWRPPAAVLFESESLRGNPPPRREAGQGFAADVAPSLTGSGSGRGVERPRESQGQDPIVAHTLNAKGGSGRNDFESEMLLAHSLRADGFDASEDGTGRGTPLVPVFAIQGGATRENPDSGPGGVGVRGDGCAYTLEARREVQAIAFSCKDHGADAGDLAPTMRAMGHDGSHANAGGQLAVATDWAVRRLTPRECERLQGAPDDWSNITRKGKPIADGPRYKMLGNSFAVPVIRWIGRRIDLVQTELALLSSS